MKASVYDVASACTSAAAYSEDKVSKSQIQSSKSHFTAVRHSVCLLVSALRSM